MCVCRGACVALTKLFAGFCLIGTSDRGKKGKSRCDEITKSCFVIELVDVSRRVFITDSFAMSMKHER